MSSSPLKQLIVIFGDQLSPSLTSIKQADKAHATILMMEVMEEASYVPHHPQKVILIFSAMRHFSEELIKKGYDVKYIKLTDKHNKHNFGDNIQAVLTQQSFDELVMTEPSEYRVLAMAKAWQQQFDLPVRILPDQRFLCSVEEFSQWAKGKKQLRMENFYRMMRIKHNVLMQQGKPIGGKWNYDQDNRQSPDPSKTFKAPPTFKPDTITEEVIQLVKRHFNNHFGDANNFKFAVTRAHALKALNQFIEAHLAEFGPEQDAMLEGEYYLHHSILSPYLNIGLLTPLEVIQKVETAYREHDLPINSVEGYIRQILGWREFIRGIYWLHMPEYAENNALQAKHALPNFYWTADTKMACMKQVINQTKETATSHHIQRLMITGNFALLYGVLPEQINEWYLAVYADAFEWVEMPNTLGMSQYADGGILASKPYAASGNYINKMSNFCKNCHYSVKQKTGEGACPFNYFYWAFLITNQKRLAHNPRLAFAYKHVNNMTSEQKQQYLQQASEFRNKENQ